MTRIDTNHTTEDRDSDRKKKEKQQLPQLARTQRERQKEKMLFDTERKNTIRAIERKAFRIRRSTLTISKLPANNSDEIERRTATNTQNKQQFKLEQFRTKLSQMETEAQNIERPPAISPNQFDCLLQCWTTTSTSSPLTPFHFNPFPSLHLTSTQLNTTPAKGLVCRLR